MAGAVYLSVRCERCGSSGSSGMAAVQCLLVGGGASRSAYTAVASKSAYTGDMLVSQELQCTV